MHPYLYAHYSYIFSLPFLGFEAHTLSFWDRQTGGYILIPTLHTSICPSLPVAAHLSSPFPKLGGVREESKSSNRAFAPI